MRTDAQIAASRANGSLSRGPKTDEGRRKIAFNALRHGLTAKTVVLSNESQEAFQEMFDCLIARYEPYDELEFGFVEEIAACRWRLRRVWGMETAMFDHEMDVQADHIEKTYERIDEQTRKALAMARLADDSKGPSLIARYETRYQRAYNSALKNLRTAQADRRKQEKEEQKAEEAARKAEAAAAEAAAREAAAQAVETEKAPPTPNEPKETAAKPAESPAPAPAAPPEVASEPSEAVRKDVTRENSTPNPVKIPSPPSKR
jgi:hypothetical protein